MAGKNGGGEMRKSSFYVWFLGAKESRGLRGAEYITPVVKNLMSREKDQEPIKVTLELTAKGMKIVQNLPAKRASDNYRENIKHFIPNSSMTCAVQEDRPNDDIVSVILLIYNPATSCPVHVHSYRCDSAETASLLLDQMNRLINQPDNQRKFVEIENRLQEKGLLQRTSSSAGSSRLGSDGRSLGRGSDSGAGSDKGSQLNPTERIATMYDSLAAELREKLGAREPLLLPPRDYDTMHRSKGNMNGVEERKSLNPRIVGGEVEETVGGGGVPSDEGHSSGIGSDDSPIIQEPAFPNEDRTSSDEDWAGDDGVGAGGHPSLVLNNSTWLEDQLEPKPLSSRFFPPKRTSSPEKAGQARRGGGDRSPEGGQKDRFKGAKQLFLSLERRKDKRASPPPTQRSPTRPPPREEKGRRDSSEVRKTAANLEVKQLEGQARWSRYEKDILRGPPEQDSRWPKSDRDTGYVSRYSRDKSRSRDFDESPPAGGGGGRGGMFTKSGKKSNNESKEKYTSRRLSRFLSRETLESDGYDKIEEFDEPDPQRNKVKRNPSRTSLKLDMRKLEAEKAPEVPPGPRRGMLRREVTELDFKGYMQSYKNNGGPHPHGGDGFSKKYIPRQGPIWPHKERALSPTRALSPVRRGGGGGFVDDERFPATKIIPAEFRRERSSLGQGGDQRYPSLDLRNDKRKSLFESDLRKQYEPGQDYRRRSYHELSDIDKLEPSRNFQHSGRKMPVGEPIGLPSRNGRNLPHNYRQLPEQQRFPGLDRENSRMNLGPLPFKPGHVSRGPPLPFDHPANRPAMFRHSYAEPNPPQSFARVSPGPHGAGRFGLASLKPY